MVIRSLYLIHNGFAVGKPIRVLNWILIVIQITKKKKLTKKSARERRIKKRKIQTLGTASSIHFWGFHRVVDFYPLVGDRGFACAHHEVWTGICHPEGAQRMKGLVKRMFVRIVCRNDVCSSSNL